jgi:hypothetical protein
MANSIDWQIQRAALATRLEPVIAPLSAGVGDDTVEEVMAERAGPCK